MGYCSIMGKIKYRKRRIIRPEKIVSIPVKREIISEGSIKQRSAKEINLTDEDKVIYIYECEERNKVVEVVNVSYQILIDSNWITILRFDSEHGYLHGHRRVSLNSEREIFFTTGVKKKGDPHKWLTWAVQYLKKNYNDYKRGFLKRSRKVDKEK